MGVEVYCRGRSNPTRGPKLGSTCIQTSPPVDGQSADNSRLLRRGEPLGWTKINPLDPEAWPTAARAARTEAGARPQDRPCRVPWPPPFQTIVRVALARSRTASQG